MSGYVSVIAGRAKGKRLKVPTGQSVRPTASRARTKLFARVEHHIRRADGRYGWTDIDRFTVATSDFALWKHP